MAFNLRCEKYKLEYRTFRSGTSTKTGNPWLSLVFEDREGNQLSISVPSDMIADIYNMHLYKGSIYEVDFLAVARADGSNYLLLLQYPSLIEEDEDY